MRPCGKVSRVVESIQTAKRDPGIFRLPIREGWIVRITLRIYDWRRSGDVATEIAYPVACHGGAVMDVMIRAAERVATTGTGNEKQAGGELPASSLRRRNSGLARKTFVFSFPFS